MKRILLAILSMLICASLLAQNDVVDIITLKNQKGVIKGFISEQVPGVTIKIIPTEAVLKFNNDTITGISKKSNTEKDSIKIDVITIKGGSSMEGIIIEQAPNKWILFKTKNSTPLTFNYDEIEKVGKETVNPNADIFKAYGVLDVVTTNSGFVQKGIIIEQQFGKTLKIKGVDKNVFVLDVSDIKSISKEPLDSKKDIFKQSAFLDIIYLKNNSYLKGIITQQNPGYDITIEMVGNSNFVQKISDVIKLSKEINPYRVNDTINIPIKEPEFIGDCYLLQKSDSIKLLEKQQFVVGTRSQNLLLINGTEKSTLRFIQNQQVTLRVKVKSNDLSPIDQIYIFKIDYDKGTKKRCIDSNKHLIMNVNADRESKPNYITYTFTKVGVTSFDVSFSIQEAGEYVVYVDGCTKSFSLFGVDVLKPISNGNNNNRQR